MKKRSPKEIIESKKNPELEQAYVKFPGEEMMDVSLERYPDKVTSDLGKIEELSKRKKKRYLDLHTHPGGDIIPSPQDIKGFLKHSFCKSMVVASLQKNGKLKGYFILRKTKQTPKHKYFSRSEEKYRKSVKEIPYLNHPQLKHALENLANKYKLQYRYIPVEKSNEIEKYLSTFFKGKGLEKKLGLFIIGGSFILSLFFLSAKITGNTILNLSSANQKIIGTFLFIFCLIAILFYLKKIKKRGLK